jgi:hypothetical protein
MDAKVLACHAQDAWSASQTNWTGARAPITLAFE